MNTLLIGVRSLTLTATGAFAAILLAGCSTTPKAPTARIVFPPPPDQPRVQYLASFGTETDLGSRGRFMDFIVGPDQRIFRPIWKPYGVAATKGFFYVTDTQAYNLVTVDLARRRFHYLRPAGEAAMRMPVGVAVDADGTRYIADSKRGQVLVYDRHGRYLEAIGAKDEFRPCGIAVDRDRLYFADLQNRCVRVYQKADRKLLFTAPHENADPKAKLFSPTNVAVDPQGRIYVTDTGGFSVQVYDRDGAYLRGLGELGVTPGRFALPKGIGVDREGRTYVVDAASTVVQLFDNEGRLLMYFGIPETSGPAGLYLPAGLAIDYENVDRYQHLAPPGYRIEYLILVVNQAGPQKVSIFGFLQKK